jgi:hypothetical protein
VSHFSRETPDFWRDWAYHVTSIDLLESIAQHGLRPELPRDENAYVGPVIYVEPDLENVLVYHHPEKTAVLRFRTPGFGELDNGEAVLFGQSEYEDGYPEPPFVAMGPPGESGIIPAVRLQILDRGKWRWLVDDSGPTKQKHGKKR